MATRKWRGAPMQRREHPHVTASRNVGYIEAMAGRPIPELHAGIPAAPKKRAPRQPSTEPVEKDVLAAVGDLLAVHPNVLFAVRQNSGAMQYQGSDGRGIPVWFYKIARAPKRLTIVDYWGFLRDGKPFALECKRASWKGPSDEREMRQQAFMQMLASIGGVTGFVCSSEAAEKVLAS